MMVQKTTSFKKKGKSKGKGKGKGKTQDEIESLKAKLKKLKLGPKPDTECYHCHEIGRWKRNCKKFLAEMKKNKGSKTSSSGINVIQINLATSPTSSWVFDTGLVAHICNSV